MAKLTDTQLIMLSKAAARDDGIAAVVRSKPGMPAWREDDDGRSISLMTTRAGRDAIAVDDDEEAKHAPRSDGKTAPRSPSHGNGDGAKSSASVPSALNVASPRAGSKQALVTEMLSANGGATLDALIKATGWPPHTTRAALTGLRKRAFSIERTREKGSDSIYRIVATPEAAAA
jgi:hypothetical protein